MRLRPVEKSDLNALLAVSLATGFAGGDAAHLYNDGKLIGLIYSAPYACLEPSLSLVAEDGEGVCGFAVGVVDTIAWEARLEREWWPPLRAEYPRPVGPSSDWTADQRRCAMIHFPSQTPDFVAQAYPAHMHLNLHPRIQGQGVGKVLAERWMRLAQDRNANTVHVGVNHENKRALRFWERRGFQVLTVGPAGSRTMWMGRSEGST
jgi:ribosomal protein S18 acetylase RimI-like enzyme